MTRKAIDLKGKKFGKLTVIGRSDRKNNKVGLYWDCKCECGEIKAIRSDVLRKTNIQSCGCTLDHVKIGDKVGNLTVSEKLGRIKEGRSIFWRCECSCGGNKDITISSHAIKDGNIRSCGCLLNPNGKYHPCYTGYKDLPGGLFHRIENGAITRNLSFKISIKQIWDLFEKQNKKCALSGLDIQFGINSRIKEKKRECTASLDRIDNSKGYTINNVQWLHKDINKMKNTHTQEYFIKICKKIESNN